MRSKLRFKYIESIRRLYASVWFNDAWHLWARQGDIAPDQWLGVAKEWSAQRAG